MNHSKLISNSLLGLVAMMSFTAQAGVTEQEWTGIEAEVRSCVAKVADTANYDNATRVRHAVVDVKERTVGYKLTIETSLYNEQGEAPIRAYASSCVVNGNNQPLQFSIDETNNDA